MTCDKVSEMVITYNLCIEYMPPDTEHVLVAMTAGGVCNDVVLDATVTKFCSPTVVMKIQ